MKPAAMRPSRPTREWPAMSCLLWLRRAAPAPRAAGIRRGDPFQHVPREILEDRGVELVVDFLAMASGGDEATLAEDREVPRDGRPARVEARRDFPRRARA